MTGSSGIRRSDLDNREIAVKWIEGVSLLRIATEYDCSVKTITNRLAKAREEFPELAWDERQVKVDRDSTSIKDYVDMRDGKQGTSRLRSGSVIRGTSMRKRNL